jgi:hypothetical protein
MPKSSKKSWIIINGTKYVAVYIAYILYFNQDTNTDINYCTSTSW